MASWGWCLRACTASMMIRFARVTCFFCSQGTAYAIRRGHGSRFVHLAFIVKATLLHMDADTGEMMPIERVQPDAYACWGAAPVRLTILEAGHFPKEIHYLSHLWWDEGMAHTKSCVRLARLLDIFIANEHGQLVHTNNKPMPFTEGPIARAVHAAQGRIADFKSTHDLANYVAMSRSNFYRLFKQTRNEPPGAFLRRERRLHAMELLRTTSNSIAEIAAAVGYSSTQQWTKLSDWPVNIRQRAGVRLLVKKVNTKRLTTIFNFLFG